MAYFNEEIQEGGSSGEILVDASDTTLGFLSDKLIAGANITLTTNNVGGNESLTIASSGSGGGTSIVLSEEIGVTAGSSKANSGSNCVLTVSEGFTEIGVSQNGQRLTPSTDYSVSSPTVTVFGADTSSKYVVDFIPVASPPSGLITEGGDNLTTEGGDNLTTES